MIRNTIVLTKVHLVHRGLRPWFVSMGKKK